MILALLNYFKPADALPESTPFVLAETVKAVNKEVKKELEKEQEREIVQGRES